MLVQRHHGSGFLAEENVRKKKDLLNSIPVYTVPYSSYRTTQEPYDTDLMAKDFLMQFSGLALTVGQPIVFQFQDKKILGLVVKSLEAVDPAAAMSDKAELKKTVFGRLLGNSTVQFEKAESSSINLIGKAKG